MFEELMSGEGLLRLWLVLFLVVGIAAGVVTGYFRARKIQPNGFSWSVFRFEIMMAVINTVVSGAILGFANEWLVANGWISVSAEPASWWLIAVEYALYFFLFDTWFYWLHRWMHTEPVYTWVHKIHHRSRAPNLVSTFSVNPLESFINGGFVPLFLTVFMVHEQTLALIVPTNVLMGIYVHSGYELLPRWWHKNWTTKWFITASFHDQHHKFVTTNYGGYTTLWDYLCGTVRPRYHHDLDALYARKGAFKSKSVPLAD
jgi:sterol desaturase/sphingolipid hydroxylase (fatty acid hydroxylase superfamily)